ncbi:MAG: MMPL family transporter [Pseudomonadota bacterium]
MWSETIFKRRPLILTLTFVVILVAGVGVKNLKVNSDTRSFYAHDDVYMQRLMSFEETYQPTRKVLFAIHSPKEIEVDGTKREALRWLSTEVAKLPEAVRVDSLATVSYPYASAGDVVVDPYLDYICPDSECIGSRLYALEQPLVVKRLISSDRRAMSVIGVFNIDRDSTEKLATIARKATLLKRDFSKRYPEIDVYLTGGIPVSQEYVAASRRDITTLFALAGVILVLALRLLLGDFKNTALMLGSAMSVVLSTMGIAGWLGIQLTSATTTVPIMLLTLIVASSMHLFLHFLRLVDAGTDIDTARITALNANYVPILLTTATSAISLASLWFISSPPLKELGLLAAIGMVAGGFLTITVTPLFLNARSTRDNSVVNAKMQMSLNAYAKRLERGSSIPLVSFCLLFVFLIGLSVLKLEDDFVAYLSERTEVRQDTDFAIKHLAGPSHIEVEVYAEDSIFDPRALLELQELTTRLRTLPNVASASSLSDIMENTARAFGETGISELTGDALSQYFFVYELGLRAGDSSSDIVNFEHTSTHIPLLLSSTKASDVRSIELEVERWLREDYEYLSGVVTGENSPVAHLSTSNIPAVAKTVIISLAMTSFILGVVFSNWRFGLNALVAISLPILCGLGAWGWISGEIGLSGAIVIAVALGVVIDDAIHLLYQQRQSLNRGESPIESMSYSVHRVGVPILATTILFVLGFSPLLFSNFDVNVTFAAVTCLVLAISLLFDLTVLPKLMEWAAKSDVTITSPIPD